MNQPLMKWTGSKRAMAEKIISFFPQEINKYYEPFLGGGSVFFKLLSSGKRVNEFVLSDKNESLIKIFKIVSEDYNSLAESYSTHWNNLRKDSEYFYQIRQDFNSTKCPHLFFFLTRTCYNGTIRYNSKGEFNTSHHFGRAGMNPAKIKEVLEYYNKLMEGKPINFSVKSFEEVSPLNSDDAVYLDPPYTNTKALYFGNISIDKFSGWVNNLQCNWFLNLNGVNSGDNEEKLNINYEGRELINSGNSSFSRMKGNSVDVKEYFYYKKVSKKS